MTLPPVRVVKVGGSLLGWKGLPAALMQWLALQSPAVNVLLAGGGEFADVIRSADARHGLGNEAAHWLCVDVLSVTARLLGALMNAPVVTLQGESACSIPALCVFDPGPYVRTSEKTLRPQPLPHTWAVTSDSIAARVALYLAADELVLLKSCLPMADLTGYLDEYFPIAAANLARVRCVNLRGHGFEECDWDRQT